MDKTALPKSPLTYSARKVGEPLCASSGKKSLSTKVNNATVFPVDAGTNNSSRSRGPKLNSLGSKTLSRPKSSAKRSLNGVMTAPVAVPSGKQSLRRKTWRIGGSTSTSPEDLLVVVFWHHRRRKVGRGLEVSSGGGRDISSYLADKDRIPELLLRMVSMINKNLALSVMGFKVVGQILPGVFKIWISAISHCKYMNVKVKFFVYYTVILSIVASPMGLRDSLNHFTSLPNLHTICCMPRET